MASLLKISACVAVVAAALFFADRYFSGGVCESKARLDAKTVIITGGNTGIGKETAIDLAARGAKVIIGCRSRERGEQAVIDIKKESGSQKVFLQLLDLSSFKSVREFAKRILESETRIDILVNNAGIFMAPYTITEDGYEKQFQVNHLGHFLLTQMLIDLLGKSAPSRIINVSSLGHRGAKMSDFDDLGDEKLYNGATAYGLSKLANVVYAKELSRRYSKINITAYSLHPGVVETEIGRHLFARFPTLKIIWNMLSAVTKIVIKTSKEGAQTTICLAAEENIEKYSGEYFADCAVSQMSSVAQDQNFAERLWQFSMKATQLE